MLTAAVISLIYSVMSCDIAYCVRVGRHSLGVVKSPDMFSSVVDTLEAKISSDTGESYKFDREITYSLVTARPEAIMQTEEIETSLLEQISNEVTQAYTLCIDGEKLGSNKSEQTLSAILKMIEDKKLAQLESSGEDVDGVEISNDIDITYGLCLVTSLKSAQELSACLGYSSETLSDYIKDAGDETAGKILEYGFIATPKFAAAPTANEQSVVNVTDNSSDASLNAEFAYGINRAGDDVLNIASEIKYTVSRIEYVTETIPYPTEYIDSIWYYEGTEAINNYGSNGSRDVVYSVDYIDGAEVGREIISLTVTREPVAEVIIRGTSPVPTPVPTGTFIWPCASHYVTSDFGGRSLFSSYDYHLGIDLGASYGSSVYASDGGTVTYTGYNSSYGHHIIISHGSVYSTLYAHLSSIEVSYGEKVYQGQRIAYSGNSGVTTGAHLHFEVRKYGSVVDPINYLP